MTYPYNEILLSHKRGEALIDTTTQMNFEDITVSERRQSQRTIYCILHSPFIPNAQNRRSYRDRKGITDCLDLGVGVESDYKWAQDFLR